MAGSAKKFRIKKSPDKMTVLKDALTGNEKATSKVMRAFQTLMRRDSEESDEESGGQRPGQKKKTPPRR